jgi:hypothetical protein
MRAIRAIINNFACIFFKDTLLERNSLVAEIELLYDLATI